jgi:hypothetical protein
LREAQKVTGFWPGAVGSNRGRVDFGRRKIYNFDRKDKDSAAEKRRKEMKKTLISGMIVLVLAAPMLAGVVKKTKSDITFRGFGKFSLVQSEKLTSDLKWADIKSDFKGQGIAGGLAGKTVLRSGDTGEIIDLPQSTVSKLDNKKKEYTVGPIEKFKQEEGEEKTEAKKEEKPAESHIKITKSEFKVEDTGEESTINNFPVRKYLVHWLTEWEDTETGDKGSSRLETLLWTTPLNDTLQKARQEEMKFYGTYMEKVGINVPKTEEDVLGMKWLAILDAFGKTKGQPDRDFSKAAQEMQKIKGYPIVVDGQYFATGQKAAGEEAEAGQEESKDVKGTIGGLLKKTMKKKPADASANANEPALTYHTEVLEISTPDLGASDFQVPAGYKKK